MAKVLIVEDDRVIAEGMARHLSSAGFDPVVVGKGEQGLAGLRFERPDVVIPDLMLPNAAGGGWSGRRAPKVSPRRSSSSPRAGRSTTACTHSRSVRTTTWSSRSR